MAPGPGGTLFVSIPRPGGSVLALLDRSGRPQAGWPIAFNDSTSCGLLLPLEDGSVRVVCDATEVPRPDPGPADVRAFAFDAGGRSMAGWPVQLEPASRFGDRPGYTGRVVGDELTLFAQRFLPDTDPNSWVTTVAADGSIRRGTDVPRTCCDEAWAVGPDGVAYDVVPVGERPLAKSSRITALDLDGVRVGWPVKIDGIASGPAFGQGGRIVVTVGSFVRRTSRVLVFDRDGKAVSASSAKLPIATLQQLDDDVAYECIADSPQPPLVAQDGTIFVFSEIDTAVYALDTSLAIMRGWPFEPATPLVRPWAPDPRYDITCPSLGRPAVGPDSILYLPLQARGTTGPDPGRGDKVGGSIVAVGPDGRVRPGWPVELPRPGAEFWSVVVGPDGTAYALAIRPETGDGSSASILAIAPDSTVLYRTTIIDP